MAENAPAALPDSRLGHVARFPWVTLSLAGLAALGGVLALSPWLELGPGVAPALFGFLFLLLLAGAVLEYALGSMAHVFALVLAALLGVVSPLLISGREPTMVTWLPLAGAALVGLNLGLVRGWRTRPLYFAAGWPGRLTLPWYAVLALWLVYEGVAWWFGRPSFSVLQPLLCFVAGLGVGYALDVLGLTRGHVMSPGYVEQVIEQGAAEVEALIKEHKVARACRIIDRLVRVAPQDLDLRRLRYAVWKYRPTHDGFHDAARDLLDRPATDPATNAFVESMYQDYLAVSQGRPRLPIEFHLALAERFARNHKVEDAAIIVNVHLQRTPKHPAIPSALLALANGYLVTDRAHRAAFYADTLLHLFPDSLQAGPAREILARVMPDA